MKNLILTALGASLIITGASAALAISDTTNYVEKQAYEQSKSSQMRLEYYSKYKTKGYDVSLLTPELLDGTKTTESQFWEALKQVQNNHEVPQRREYVAKFQAKGYDVSGFTESVILDSGRFWEMIKLLESEKKPVTEVKKETVKKEEVQKKETEKKTESNTKVVSPQSERLKSLMKARIAKIPAANREATLSRLEQALTKSIAAARARKSTLLATRYEILLAVVQEEMNTIDDDTLVNSLFTE